MNIEHVFITVEKFSQPFLFTLIAIDFIFLFSKGLLKNKKEGFMNIINYIVPGIPYLLIIFIVQYKILFWVYENLRLFTLPNQWFILFFCYIVYDLIWWLVHYLSHNVRFFWCIHGVHHTPEEMNFSVSVRGSLFDFLISPHIIIWLPILGFHPFMIYIVEITARLYGVFTHANDNFFKKTPFLDKIFITPHLHRVHHSRNPLYVDTNYANMFSFWDRLFGTYQEEIKEVKPKYGVMDREIKSTQFKSTQFKMWIDLYKDIKNAPNWSNKFQYLIMPPGWNHMKSGKLGKDYRKEAIAKYNR